MRLEIESAANFLSNFLRLQPNVLNGDQLEIFRETILKLLTNHYQQHWFPEKPVRGSGYRCLRINHKMDPIIAKAGTCVGLNEAILRGFLPKELTLWVDPKEVSYRIGENGSICVLFNGDNQSSTAVETTAATITINNNSNGNNFNDNKQVQQQQLQQSPARKASCSPSPSLSSSYYSSTSSSASSSLSNSPTSSLDWSSSVHIDSRRSPISATPRTTNQQQMISPTSSIRSAAAAATGSEATGFVRSGFALYDNDLLNGHQQQQQRQGRNIADRNQWNWPSYMNAGFATSHHHQQQQLHHHHQQQVQHHKQQQQYYGRGQNAYNGRNAASPPLTHYNLNGWNNYMDTFNRNRMNAATMEPMTTYVSS